MLYKRGLALALCLSALLALAAAATVAAAPGRTAASPKVKASMLYVIDSKSGTLQKASGGQYTLTLRGISSGVTYFSDQPVRAAGKLSSRTLAALWQTMFPNGERPNAALNLYAPDARGRDMVILDLGAPRVSGSSVVFSARVIPSGAGRIAAFGARKLASIPRAFGEAALFIDDAFPMIYGQCVAASGETQGHTLTAMSSGSMTGTSNAWGSCETLTQMFDIAIAAVRAEWLSGFQGGSGVAPLSIDIPLTFTDGDFSLSFVAHWRGGGFVTGTFLDANKSVGDGFSSIAAMVS